MPQQPKHSQGKECIHPHKIGFSFFMPSTSGGKKKKTYAGTGSSKSNRGQPSHPTKSQGAASSHKALKYIIAEVAHRTRPSQLIGVMGARNDWPRPSRLMFYAVLFDDPLFKFKDKKPYNDILHATEKMYTNMISARRLGIDIDKMCVTCSSVTSA